MIYQVILQDIFSHPQHFDSRILKFYADSILITTLLNYLRTFFLRLHTKFPSPWLSDSAFPRCAFSWYTESTIYLDLLILSISESYFSFFCHVLVIVKCECSLLMVIDYGEILRWLFFFTVVHLINSKVRLSNIWYIKKHPGGTSLKISTGKSGPYGWFLVQKS